MASAADIPALVRHLRSGSKAHQLRAAAALEALARQSRSNSQIVNAGGIAALASCLQHSGSTAVSKAAALALAVLGCYCPLGHGDFALAASAFPVLVRMMAGSSSFELQQAACAALNNLVLYSEELGPVAAEAGAIPAVVQLLQSCNPVPLPVVSLVATLVAGSQECCEEFAAAGGVAALLRCLPTAGADAQPHVLGALANLADLSQSSRDKVVQAGGIALLAQHLKDSRSSSCQEQVCRALANLASRSEGARVAILAADVMPAAVQLLAISQPHLQGTAAGLICNLCMCEQGKREAQQAGAISALLRVLREGDSGGPAVLGAAGALQNSFVYWPASAAAAVAAGAISLLQQLACSAASKNVRDAASSALTSLQQQGAGTVSTASESASAAAAPPSAAALEPPLTCAAPGCTNTHGLRRCGGCRAVRYCGEACRNAHWRAHRADCRRLRAATAVAGGEVGHTTAAA